MELCSIEMTVLIDIIEKIPTIIPIIVNDDLNLFACNEVTATLKSSKIFIYSYLNASTGSNLAAVNAGAKPDNTPVIIEITIARITASI